MKRNENNERRKISEVFDFELFEGLYFMENFFQSWLFIYESKNAYFVSTSYHLNLMTSSLW